MVRCAVGGVVKCQGMLFLSGGRRDRHSAQCIAAYVAKYDFEFIANAVVVDLGSRQRPGHV